MTLREDALDAVKAAVRAADPESFIREKVRFRGSNLAVGPVRLDLSGFERIFVVGGGKASLGMALGVDRLLGGWITDGLVNIPEYLQVKLGNQRIRFNRARHPIPSKRGVRGVEKMVELVGRTSPRDLVICLLSGGASAMMPLPVAGLGLRDKQEVTRRLLASGASIGEVNTVRRHLSGVKGGRLAERFCPAMVLSLIISDVAGDRLEGLGSGPTAPDPSTYKDARRVLEKYDLWNDIPKTVRDIIEKGQAGLLNETPKPGSEIFRRVHNVIVGSNRESCTVAAETLRKKGYRTIVLTRSLEGEARSIGKIFSSILSDLNQGQLSLRRPVALVAGGETTVTVKGIGTGGRNQELVLSAALGIQDLPDVLVASAGTDGLDGPTDAAGAVADGTTVMRALRSGLDPGEFLANNDSYSFFKRLKDLIITGPTGTNVKDITIALGGLPGRKTLGREVVPRH